MTVIVGVSFIVAVSQIYYNGIVENPDYPFELTRIKEHILMPLIFLLCEIAAIIIGFILSVIYPISEKRTFNKNSQFILKKLKPHIPLSGDKEFAEAHNKISKYELFRKCIWGFSFAIFFVSGISILLYAYNFSHYLDTHKDILNLVRNVMGWTLAGLLCGIIAIIVDNILLKREISIAKIAIKTGDKTTTPITKPVKKKAIIFSSIAASVVTVLAIIGYILVPIIAKSVLSLSQTIFYIVIFVIAALIAVGFTIFYVVKDYVPNNVSKILLYSSRAIIGITAIVFIVVGVLNDGANDVLKKAIEICTECIGLG